MATIVLGHNVRRWTNYTTTRDLTPDEIETLEGEDFDAVRKLAELEAAGVVMVSTWNDDDNTEPFAAYAEPEVLGIYPEEG